MGNNKSKDKIAKQTNASIEEKMKKEKKLLMVNVLLLGPGGGGKTTIFKQMERIHGIKPPLLMKSRERQERQERQDSSQGTTSDNSLLHHHNSYDNNDPLFTMKRDTSDELAGAADEPLVSSNYNNNNHHHNNQDESKDGTSSNRLIHTDSLFPENLAVEVEFQILKDICDLCRSNVQGRKQENLEEYELEDKSLEPFVEQFAAIDLQQQPIQLDIKVAEVIERLWKDKGIQYTFERDKIFNDMDNTPYFLDRVKRYATSSYKITFGDYVRLSDRTSGIVTTQLEVMYSRRPFRIQITDVGGQRAEQRKWLPLFNGTDAVIWVMSLSSYDQMLYEDKTKNRYEETFELFERYCHNKNFEKTEFVVFLNKFDVFEQKIATIPFTKYKRDFDEDKINDPTAVIEFVQQRYEQIFYKKKTSSTVYFHVTSATDDKQIEQVIATVKFAWMKKALEVNAYI